MCRAINTQIRFRDLYKKGENYVSAELEAKTQASREVAKMVKMIPEDSHYWPARIYPQIPISEGEWLPAPPKAFQRVKELPLDDLVYDTELNEFVVKPGYISEDGLIDDESVVWHPEEMTVMMKYWGGVAVTWPYWKPITS